MSRPIVCRFWSILASFYRFCKSNLAATFKIKFTAKRHRNRHWYSMVPHLEMYNATGPVLLIHPRNGLALATAWLLVSSSRVCYTANNIIPRGIRYSPHEYASRMFLSVSRRWKQMYSVDFLLSTQCTIWYNFVLNSVHRGQFRNVILGLKLVFYDRMRT